MSDANKIAEGLAAAERGKSDAEQAEKRVAETLAEGRQQVAELVANADKRAAQIVEEARSQKAVKKRLASWLKPVQKWKLKPTTCTRNIA